MSTEESFESWYRREAPALTARICAAVGDQALGVEVAAEAMARAYERWHRVSRMAAPEGWVYRVAVNLWRRWWRRRGIERRANERVHRSSAPDLTFETFETGSSRCDDEELNSLVAHLPTRMQTAVKLRYWDDMTEQQVADAMAIAPGTASALLSQARRRLATSLSTEQD